MIDWREERSVDDTDRPTREIIWRDAERLPEFYRRLGVEPGCSPQQIKQAYRIMAKQCHPDCQPPSQRPNAERRMAELNAAYEVLGNRERRIRYDAEHGFA